MAKRLGAPWTRTPGASGGTCGARWAHPSGWTIQHCGHPTALWPYALYNPQGALVLAPNGRAFRHLTDAAAAATCGSRHADDPQDRGYECRLERGHAGRHVDTRHPMHPSWV